MSALLSSIDVILQDGFMYAILAMGYYVSYTILDFPDLTVEGTITTGGAIAAIMITSGVNPWLSCIAALGAGLIGGLVTALLHTKLQIPALLSGILRQIICNRNLPTAFCRNR